MENFHSKVVLKMNGRKITAALYQVTKIHRKFYAYIDSNNLGDVKHSLEINNTKMLFKVAF